MNTSRSVTSNQTAIHPDLIDNLVTYMDSDYRRPIPDIAIAIYDDVKRQISSEQRPLILDSGCGVGQSTRILAEQHPQHWVIGIDQSEHRITKQSARNPDNMILVRANCVDFWRLALADGWQLDKHFLLFPNPWPKKEHLQRRWHGHPVFPTLLKLGGYLELRTNWHLYALEFQTALGHLGYSLSEVETYLPGDNYLTPFEKKYHESGQELFRLTSDL